MAGYGPDSDWRKKYDAKWKNWEETSSLANVSSLLAQFNKTCPGDYAAAGDINFKRSSLSLKLASNDMKLPIPFSKASLKSFKAASSLAPVGTRNSEEVNLEARTSFQLLPSEFTLSDAFQPLLDNVLSDVLAGLNFPTNDSATLSSTDTVSYKHELTASLYKALLYEPGCFFKRHRDNARVDDMFGTLVIELPAGGYEGGELSVFPPDGDTNQKMIGRDDPTPLLPGVPANNSIRRRVFFSDCYHQVSELTKGARVCLIYNLAATPITDQPTAQPLHIASSLASKMTDIGESNDPDKPIKLVVGLKHHYNFDTLRSRGVSALKGADKPLGDLIALAQRVSAQPTTSAVNDLRKLSAKAVLNSASDEANGVSDLTAGIIDDALNSKEDLGEPTFDAFLSLCVVWDSGEGTPEETCYTTGPLYPLQPIQPTGEKDCKLPFDVGSGSNYDTGETALTKHGGYFGGPDLDDSDDETPEAIILECGPTNWSMPIYEAEVCLEPDKRRGSRDDYIGLPQKNDKFVSNQAERGIEFLGNGMPYMGYWWNKAVIVMWPKGHRESVRATTIGGTATRENADAIARGERAPWKLEKVVKNDYGYFGALTIDNKYVKK